MQTHPIHVTGGRQRVLEIRRELFVFSDVLEVFVTSRPDVLVVVCAGHARPTQWLQTLSTAGYHIPARRSARPDPQVETPIVPSRLAA